MPPTEAPLTSAQPRLIILRVAIASPLRRLFDYLPAPDENKPLQIGSRLSVPFGHQKAVMGILVEITDNTLTPTHKLKPIHNVIDDQPVVEADILALCQWCASYYQHPLGDVLHTAIPTLLRRPEVIPQEYVTLWQLTEQGRQLKAESLKRAKRQAQAWTLLSQSPKLTTDALTQQGVSTQTLKALVQKGLAHSSQQPRQNPSLSDVLPNTQTPLSLNAEQASALERIRFNHYGCYLLEGVTGSGKTEVYLQAIAKVLDHHQQALVLVPEIGLTPQTLGRFEARFNTPIALLHSGLSDKQRYRAWQQAKSGVARIVIGTRSSVFTDLPALGLIIVDEEHDLSYKQQEGIRYCARDVAVVRAKNRNIPLLLGSATPALESLHNALSGRYQHLVLQQRATRAPLPLVNCIDTADESIAANTLTAIGQALAQQQQVLVFINRRGYAPVLICGDCSWISQCQHCDSRMTLHQHPHRLHCHHCDTRMRVPTQCPNCHSHQLHPLGQGTQRSEEQLTTHFPDTDIIRIDRDTTRNRQAMATAITSINSGKPCILVGTQMLAKGHHFPNVSLVVVLGLDSHFFSGDFRGPERMGQLLTQVSGRAGRASLQGRVLLQTQFSDHPLLQQLLQEGYHTFAKQLLQAREQLSMPPYCFIALIRCHAQQPTAALGFLQQARTLAEACVPASDTLSYIGPLPAAMEKRNNRYHYQLQIKAHKRSQLHHLLNQLGHALESHRQPKGLHWVIDVDPQET